MRVRTERRFAEEEARVRDLRREVEEAEGRDRRRRREEEEQDDERMREEDEEEDEESEDEVRNVGVQVGDSSEDDEDDGDDYDDESTASSINTARQHTLAETIADLARGTVPDLFGLGTRAGAIGEPIAVRTRGSPSPSPAAPLDSFIRRNFDAGYAPLTLAPVAAGGPSSPGASLGRIPSYASPPHLSASLATSGRTPASFYYATYLPSSSASSTSYYPLPHLPGSLTFSTTGNLNASSGAGAYYPASAYFPLDSAPGDLLGLDWDERGERLFVATAARVWEWEVDREARRGSAAWGVR
ncbi:hypothetical protein DMC30DRAFT_390996 [Rhodotorula diobovata]|uniref:Uncharacterized protein n=1 Tax=Rhodotorula diobovata TaxID=5288 RepID=A0A5C5G326_9BASI|nr:hypothetical protein DMC30DRAFT_390996 [Rhodotorula diobovata]